MDPTTGNIIMGICLIAGSAMVILEAFIPGFGVAGTLGIILEIAGVVLAWLHHGTLFAVILTVIVLAIIAATVYLSYRSAMRGRISKSPLILHDQAQAGEKMNTASWQGREGTAATAMRPSGFVEIDGQRLNAASEGEWIAKGARVRVVGSEGDHLVVRETKNTR